MKQESLTCHTSGFFRVDFPHAPCGTKAANFHFRIVRSPPSTVPKESKSKTVDAMATDDVEKTATK